jgi:hypothetical protein
MRDFAVDNPHERQQHINKPDVRSVNFGIPPMTMRFMRSGMLLILLAALPALSADAGPGTAASNRVLQNQSHGFDFLMGTWTVKNTFLAKRLQHSHQWLHFDSLDLERQLPTGTGNIETYKTSFWPGFVGVNVRLYNPDTHEWSIYWTDNRFSRGVMQPPGVGSFRGESGIFETNDHFNGTPIVVRYTYQKLDRNHAKWTQAFSTDQGKTWEVNWIMDFTRLRPSALATRLTRPAPPQRR